MYPRHFQSKMKNSLRVLKYEYTTELGKRITKPRVSRKLLSLDKFIA